MLGRCLSPLFAFKSLVANDLHIFNVRCCEKHCERNKFAICLRGKIHLCLHTENSLDLGSKLCNVNLAASFVLYGHHFYISLNNYALCMMNDAFISLKFGRFKETPYICSVLLPEFTFGWAMKGEPVYIEGVYLTLCA